ncbi:putative glutaredoxin [Hamiltosporidium tvaerminnensis]|uniref:Putative glutaredoxin n=1 Tax=Hamiltosporidium tvaerminnensis TaxID=1176355 RepID=A0A4V2JVI2_9MICR|nr:putative glutaredoxin [Hamiltosporidium tvaerminnensis]
MIFYFLIFAVTEIITAAHSKYVNLTVPEFEKIAKNNKITILTSPTCKYCLALKNTLNKMGVPYVDIELGANPLLYDLMTIVYGYKYVPAIFLCGEFIGGYDKFLEKYNLTTDDNSVFDNTFNVKKPMIQTGVVGCTNK